MSRHPVSISSLSRPDADAFVDFEDPKVLAERTAPPVPASAVAAGLEPRSSVRRSSAAAPPRNALLPVPAAVAAGAVATLAMMEEEAANNAVAPTPSLHTAADLPLHLAAPDHGVKTTPRRRSTLPPLAKRSGAEPLRQRSGLTAQSPHPGDVAPDAQPVLKTKSDETGTVLMPAEPSQVHDAGAYMPVEITPHKPVQPAALYSSRHAREARGADDRARNVERQSRHEPPSLPR